MKYLIFDRDFEPIEYVTPDGGFTSAEKAIVTAMHELADDFQYLIINDLLDVVAIVYGGTVYCPIPNSIGNVRII